MAYTLATGLLWLKDINVESDSKTMSGTCKNAGDTAQVGTVVYFEKGRELILMVDGREQAFVKESDVRVFKNG